MIKKVRRPLVYGQMHCAFPSATEQGTFLCLQFCLLFLPHHFLCLWTVWTPHPIFRSGLCSMLSCPSGPCTCYFLNLRFSFPLLSESFFFFLTFVKSFLYFLHRVNLSFPEALPSPSRVSVWLSSGQLKIISSTWVQKRL